MAERLGELEVAEIRDERTPLAHAALGLLREAIGDVQPLDDLLSEIEEGRLGLRPGGDYHLVALLDAEGAPVAAAAGVYLESVNAGFITYLAVRASHRRRRLGRRLRERLIAAFRADARRIHGAELAWSLGEVRRDSPWLRTLVREGRVIPFGFSYFHPWLSRRAEGRYVLYRQPVADARPELPAREVERIVYAIWRRAYRVRFPLQSETFRYMLEQLGAPAAIGADR